MNRQTALQIAQQTLTELGAPDDLLQLASDTVMDVGWAWICPWSTRRWFATGDPRDAQPPGLGPIVVVKHSGETWLLGTAVPYDDQLVTYAEAHRFQHTNRLEPRPTA
jgi:immunity protein 35 of polymorphic toxin system